MTSHGEPLKSHMYKISHKSPRSTAVDLHSIFTAVWSAQVFEVSTMPSLSGFWTEKPTTFSYARISELHAGVYNLIVFSWNKCSHFCVLSEKLIWYSQLQMPRVLPFIYLCGLRSFLNTLPSPPCFKLVQTCVNFWCACQMNSSTLKADRCFDTTHSCWYIIHVLFISTHL